MKKALWTSLLGLLLGLAGHRAWAGGSGFNVVAVVNQNSTNSVQLGNYYCEQRQVPPQNFLRINWTGTNTEWTLANYTNTLLNPLLAMLSSRKLTNQIDYVVLSMDIPYRINAGAEFYNSTSSALFYGFINDPNYNPNSCNLAANSANPYAASEGVFRATAPFSTNANFFITSMITASNLSDPEMMVLLGATSDGTFPTQTVWLGKSTDTSRNLRYPAFDNSVFNTRLRGNYSVERTNIPYPEFNNTILGYQNGSYYFGVSPVPLFVPGAMADNLTSFGGQLFEDTAGEVTLLRFISAGVSGSYGTVIEPCDYTQKFPDPQNYFYQSRGFSLGECYYQSLTNPYQGLVVGEPLAAPFARRGTGSWNGLASNAVLSGTANLSAQFTASDAQHPLQQVDLFLDGQWLQTLTNIAPQSANVVHVTLNGFATTYTVPASATIKTVTSNLYTLLNGSTYEGNTKVTPYLHGDRIELQSTAGVAKTGGQISVAVSSTTSSGALTTFIQTDNGAPSTFLDSVAQGTRGYTLTGTLLANAVITLTVTKTNNSVVTFSATNAGNSTLTEFAQQFVTALSTNASLDGLDGLYGDDVTTGTAGAGDFNLYAQGGGYAAAQIKAAFSTSAGLVITPSAANTLTANVDDLQPRENLYLTAGAATLAVAVPFVTTNQTDGYHELEAIAYEGSDVRTQTRLAQNIVIKNTSLSATMTGLLTGTNSSLEPTLQFTVTANTNQISSIQLFSTGGALASINNQSSAVFAIALPTLDVGLHPFYAIVTDNSGHQFRTQTQNVRFTGVNDGSASLIGVGYPFTLTFTGPPVTLTWPATAGRAYNVISTTNLTTPFQTRAVVIPTSSVGQWTETNSSPAQQFYGVSVTP